MKTLLLILYSFLFIVSISAQKKISITEALSSYDYGTALQLIEKEKPTLPILYQRGTALKGLGHINEALQTYQDIISKDSLNPRAYIEAAECSRQLYQDQQALKYYTYAIHLNPENKYARIQYITILLSQQMYNEALHESEIFLKTDTTATTLYLKAQSLEGLDKPEDAIECYRSIQNRNPSDCLAATKLGLLYNSAEKYQKAIEATEIYRQKDSTNFNVNRQNALAYCLKEDYPTAIKRYDYLISHKDSTLQTIYYMGVCYYALEKYYEAHDLLEIALKKAPNNVNLLYYLGRSCAMTSWKKEGVDYLEKAIKLTVPKDSDMIRLYVGMEDCYKMAGMYQKEIDTKLERYKSYTPQNHKLLYDAALIYEYGLKDTPNAERYLEMFLKTRVKDNRKNEQAADNNSGGTITATANYYNAAENWLNDIRTKKKEKAAAKS